MKKVVLILFCVLFLCSCGIVDFINSDFSSTEISSNIVSTTSSLNSSDVSSEKPININTKIYAAKNTTTYSKDLLYPTSKYSSIDEDSYFYYSSLPKKLKPMYKTLCDSIECMADGFIDLGYINDDEISLLITCIKYDKPEYFWLGQDYIINTKKNGLKQVAFQFKSDKYTIKYLYNPKTRNTILSKLKATITSLAEKMPDSTDFDKELYIHNFLVNNCSYNKDAINNILEHQSSYNVYGSLIKQEAVCEGYAKAIQLLNNYFGIKTTVIIGNADGQNHMWNLVLIDNKYYHLDATFNDGNSSNLYSYFNLSDTAIKRTHSVDKDFYENVKLPNASSIEKSYFKVNNSLIYNDPPLEIKNAIIDAIINKKTSVDFGYSDEVTVFYKSNDELLNNGIDILKILSIYGKIHKVKVKNVKIIFATNHNFKITWDFEK